MEQKKFLYVPWTTVRPDSIMDLRDALPLYARREASLNTSISPGAPVPRC
jgi:hypothetical protein